MYSRVGRPSIAPEVLLRAKVLQALYTVRSDRQLCDRLRTDQLFRWFIGLEPDDPMFDASNLIQNQSRLLKHEVADVLFAQIVEVAREEGWASNEHFSVDGTLIEAWAPMKSSLSQKIRKRIEEIFDWMKTTGNLRKGRWPGIGRTHASAQYVVGTLNLLRIAKLMSGPPAMARA